MAELRVKLSLTALARFQLCGVLDMQTGNQLTLDVYEDLAEKIRFDDDTAKRLVATLPDGRQTFNDRDAGNVEALEIELTSAEATALRAVFREWPGFRLADRRTWMKPIREALEQPSKKGRGQAAAE